MTDYTPGEPIEVTQSPIPSHIMSTVRDLIGYGTAWAVGKGYVDAVTGTQIGGVLTIIVVWAWRQYVTSRTHSKLVTAAHAAPNAIAVVK